MYTNTYIYVNSYIYREREKECEQHIAFMYVTMTHGYHCEIRTVMNDHTKCQLMWAKPSFHLSTSPTCSLYFGVTESRRRIKLP